MITLFTDPTGLVPVVTGLITTGHSHFPADPTGLVPVVNRFDHYINGRLTAPVCSFKTLLPPAQGRWGAFLLGDALHSSQTLLPPAQGRWGVLHANIYIILKLSRMRGRGNDHALSRNDSVETAAMTHLTTDQGLLGESRTRRTSVRLRPGFTPNALICSKLRHFASIQLNRSG